MNTNLLTIVKQTIPATGAGMQFRFDRFCTVKHTAYAVRK
jgi:hypothetical protein